MIGKDEVRAWADEHALGRHFQALLGQPIRLFEESLRINHHPVAEHASLSGVYDPGRDQMEYEGLVADLYGVARIVPALIACDDVEALGQQIDDLAFSFIAPLRTDDNDYISHNDV